MSAPSCYTGGKFDERRATPMSRSRFSPRSMVYMALCAVLTAVCAWITVPGPVPFTLQTFALCCTFLLLGGRLGGVALLVYLLMGAVGLPVFSHFTGGLGVLLGPTGGYLLGFVLCAPVYSLCSGGAKASPKRKTVALLAVLLCDYLAGTAWYCLLTGTGPAAALSLCVLPFLLPDLAKLMLALALTRRLNARLSRPEIG